MVDLTKVSFESLWQNVSEQNFQPTKTWKTPEHIEIKDIYAPADLQAPEHLHFGAGIPPFLLRSV